MNLSYNDDNKKKIADKGGIEAIIEGMKKHINVAHVQEYGCGALKNLSRNKDNRKKIADKGGIEAIIEGMKKHINAAKVQEYGCGALKNLSYNDDNKRKSRTVASKLYRGYEAHQYGKNSREWSQCSIHSLYIFQNVDNRQCSIGDCQRRRRWT